MVGSLPSVPEGALLQDARMQEPPVKVMHRSNLVWDPRISAAHTNVEQRVRNLTSQQERGGSSLDYESTSSDFENAQKFVPSESQQEQPRIPLKSVAHEAKKQRMGKAAFPPRVEGKNTWEFHGRKTDGGDPSQFSTPVQRRATSETVQKVSSHLHN